MKIFAKNHFYDLKFNNSFVEFYKKLNKSKIIIIDQKIYNIYKNKLIRYKKKNNFNQSK